MVRVAVFHARLRLADMEQTADSQTADVSRTLPTPTLGAALLYQTNRSHCGTTAQTRLSTRRYQRLAMAKCATEQWFVGVGRTLRRLLSDSAQRITRV